MLCALLSPKYPEKPIAGWGGTKQNKTNPQGILAASYFHQQKELMYQYYGGSLKQISAASAIKRVEGALC